MGHQILGLGDWMKPNLQVSVQLETDTLRVELIDDKVIRIVSLYFCPDFDGRICYEITRVYQNKFLALNYDEPSLGFGYDDYIHVIAEEDKSRLNFKEPNPGMIVQAYNSLATNRCGRYKLAPLSACLMVGDLNGGLEVADAAGVSFILAKYWRALALKKLKAFVK
ncbi:MAG: hypothetical protein F6K31_31315 [Symploca sp. SIO2G7]|nr:hypothetical protein [Symploca sp. SIO2G7]